MRRIAVILSLFILASASPAEAHYRSRSRRPPPRTHPAPTDDQMRALAHCESRSNPATNTGNGYYGAFQFSLRTWRGMGKSGWPHHHSAEEQTETARALIVRSGWRSQFPGCSRRMGMR